MRPSASGSPSREGFFELQLVGEEGWIFEATVLSKRVAGKTNRVIGTMLNLSIKTVETHRAAAMRKLALSSTAELVRYAIREKLILP
jgi:DNA-binding CsgD family transcriptional regulator